MASKKTSTLHAAAQARGSRGGQKGGPARARALTAQERHRIAQKGGEARAKKK